MRTTKNYKKRVEVIRRDSSAHAAANRMTHQAVGCLVVVDEEERPVGILTDRDLLLRAVAKSHSPHELHVEDIMTRELVQGTSDEPLETLLRRMKHHGVRRIPLVEDGVVVGMVAMDDILQEFSRDMNDLASEAPLRYRDAPSHSRFEHVRHGIERNLTELRQKFEYAQWYAKATLLDELDELRSRLDQDTDASSG
jgi:CBS domain-containing protein